MISSDIRNYFIVTDTSVLSLAPLVKRMLKSGLSLDRDDIYIEKTVKEVLRNYIARCKGVTLHMYHVTEVIVQKIG